MCNAEKKKVPTQGVVSSTKKVNLLARETDSYSDSRPVASNV